MVSVVAMLAMFAVVPAPAPVPRVSTQLVVVALEEGRDADVIRALREMEAAHPEHPSVGVWQLAVVVATLRAGDRSKIDAAIAELGAIVERQRDRDTRAAAHTIALAEPILFAIVRGRDAEGHGCSSGLEAWAEGPLPKLLESIATSPEHRSEIAFGTAERLWRDGFVGMARIAYSDAIMAAPHSIYARYAAPCLASSPDAGCGLQRRVRPATLPLAEPMDLAPLMRALADT